MGKMHGVGLYTSASVGGKEGTKEEALMRDNILHCLKKGKWPCAIAVVSSNCLSCGLLTVE